MKKNIESARRLMKHFDATVLLSGCPPDIQWLSGFSGSNGFVLLTPDQEVLITDGRYTEQSQREAPDFDIHIPDGPLTDYMCKAGLIEPGACILIQADKLTLSEHAALDSQLEDIDWIPVENMLSGLRGSKSAKELDAIRKAQQVTDDVFSELINFIEPGITETEVAAFIVFEHLKRGAASMSFPPIVASGENSSLPHATPSSRIIQKGDMVVLDFGCFVDGYASDMTRTLSIGEPTSNQRRVYDAVRKAQTMAIMEAKAGMLTCDLDAAARNVLKEKDLDAYFTHSLGHGVGLEIHEWPRVSWQTEQPMPENAVITIEPGVYLPGDFGVRIEDMVVLKQEGCVNLTSSPKELIVIE